MRAAGYGAALFALCLILLAAAPLPKAGGAAPPIRLGLGDGGQVYVSLQGACLRAESELADGTRELVVAPQEGRAEQRLWLNGGTTCVTVSYAGGKICTLSAVTLLEEDMP